MNNGAYKAFIDGLCEPNPGPMSIGGVILSSAGKVVVEISEEAGKGTNNIAEYLALIRTVQTAIEIGIERVEVFTDSLLLANQLNGLYKVKSPKIIPLFERVRALRDSISFTVKWIPREQNEIADGLSRRALEA